MRTIIALGSLLSSLIASEPFESSLTCKSCHPLIFDEFYGSSHRNASIFNDPIHKAVWDKHPLKQKKQYVCAVCHTPSDTQLIDALITKQPALPQKNSVQTQEAITCIYCHKIQKIEQHAKQNRNILTTKTKTLFSARKSQRDTKHLTYKIESDFLGLVTTKSGSPFHDLDFSNPIFYNGDVCMGCHAHKQNSHHLDLCKIDVPHSQNSMTQENCITCHMPKVQGSLTTAYDSKTHRYHGFAGVSHQPKMLEKYVNITLEQGNEGFDIIIHNKANHSLLLHPLRVGELRIQLIRNGETRTLPPITFVRILGKDNRPTMPWIADTVLKDTHIKANEQRRIHLQTPLVSGDIIDVELGHYRVNPKAAAALDIAKHSKARTFTLFKQQRFHIH